VDKPVGPTSHDVVARVRKLYRLKAVGHTGTLDPFATGLLVLLLGRATRLARFVEQQPKIYLATARLGLATTTDDLTGTGLGDPAIRPLGDGPAAPELVTAAAGAVAPPSRTEVERALAGFLGPQRQRPPAFSAKRTGGERSYEKARRGETVVLPDVDIIVHTMDLVEYSFPVVCFRATVSAGTYVRALARDLGDRLGLGAHLTALRREAIGEISVLQSTPLAALDAGTPVLPPLAVLGHLPRVAVTDEQARALGHGRLAHVSGPSGAVAVAVAPGERLVAVGTCRDDGFHPNVVLEPVS
jgi:tRNA pseudouridine55 synthase